jgi:hypothetical protein
MNSENGKTVWETNVRYSSLAECLEEGESYVKHCLEIEDAVEKAITQ